jgi:hypothetical protein
MTTRTPTGRSSWPWSPLETTGEVFADGSSIELILDAETGRLSLLLCDGEDRTVTPRVDYRGKVYVPAELDPSILRALTLPTKCIDYGSTDELFKGVRESLTNHGLPTEVALPLAYFSFPTWFPECLPAAPCLVIMGPRPEACLVLQLLSCLVRHPLPLVEVSRAGLSALPMDLQPTLLIDQEHLGLSTSRLLSATNSPNAYVPRRGALVNLYCAKAIYCGGDTLDDALLGDATLQINLAPSRGRLPVLDPKTRQQIAMELQPRLLMYRLRNIAKVRESKFDLPGPASEIRILARVLGASIVDARELQGGLGPLLEEQQEEIRAERWTDLRCVAIEALLFHCHSGKEDLVHVGKLTRTATTILKGRGETVRLEPRAMGHTLRSLGLSLKRDSKGWATRFTDRACQRIHRLARDFDVAAVQNGATQCPHCAEIAADDRPGNLDESTLEEEE